MVHPEYAMSDAEADVFCSVLSREAGEPLFGSALHNDVWLLLEYDGPWGAKATVENELPPAVQAWLDEQVAAIGRGRVQFIKQERASTTDGLRFYIAETREMSPRMWRFEVDQYAALLDIDVTTVLKGQGAAHEVVEELYLVCTNGRRDRCCALFGLEVYYALREVAGDAVWQTTHVGGHRFAANVLTFPDGTYYGRIQTAHNIEAFLAARQQGEIALPYLRGRSCYDEWVQAADYYLRRETGITAIEAFVLEAPEVDGDAHVASFIARESGKRYVVRLKSQALDFSVFSSCGKPGEGPCEGYALVALEK